jgi:hypothetical protein
MSVSHKAVQRIVLYYSHTASATDMITFRPTSGTFTRRVTTWDRKRVGSNRDRRLMPRVIS